jgi:hypothetical protein
MLTRGANASKKIIKIVTRSNISSKISPTAAAVKGGARETN